VIDLHTHILPGVDDGVDSEDEAVEFARMAVADGIRTIVATPHCKDGFFVNDRAAVRDGRAPTLADNGKTLLLELSLTQYPVNLEAVIFQLKLAGIVPVLAHPERVRYFEDDVRRYEEIVRLGAYGQITTGSLEGSFGRRIREFSEEIVRKGLVHVVASDSHNTRGRPPVLSRAMRALKELVGEETALRMATDVPAASLVVSSTMAAAGAGGRLTIVGDRRW
jgi:protein-tyrosine phosphatase